MKKIITQQKVAATDSKSTTELVASIRSGIYDREQESKV